MHEMSLIESLLDSLLAMIKEHPEWRIVTRINLKVGAMRQVVPEAMEFCFNIAVEGTPLEGTKLELTNVPIQCHCRSCGHAWPGDDKIFICSSCGSPDVELTSGMELEIDTMEVEETDA